MGPWGLVARPLPGSQVCPPATRPSGLGADSMIRIVKTMGVAFVAAAFLSSAGFAAAPDLLDPEPAATAEYELDTVLVVHNWVLCVTEASAETVARAHRAGAEALAETYTDLAAAKICGRFQKLGVMLKTPLYRSGPGSDHEARVFAALVNIGVGWQDAYVVTGLPE